jgi:hypothetical protein
LLHRGPDNDSLLRAFSNLELCPQVQDSTFEQEPGSGATAIVEGKRVAVGTLEWVQRYLLLCMACDVPFLVLVQCLSVSRTVFVYTLKQCMNFNKLGTA